MPDIQAGDVEWTQAEAAAQANRNQQNEAASLTAAAQVDELGETHEEAAVEHLGHS